MNNIQKAQELKEGCITDMPWDDGNTTGTSRCGEDGIFCKECQAKIQTAIELWEDELEFLNKLFIGLEICLFESGNKSI